ncbi:MAG TPA: hypothetical protein VGR38_01395 [Candidatus Polarisedimenticolia bacterium]|nr:hypothetical protein [Candidatus Polarisedimenticolia bacterium]
MAKKIILGLVLAVVALLAFNFVSTGEITLIPTTPLSAEARTLNRLYERFVAATHQLNQAQQSSGVSGLDTTADAQAALTEMEQIERELKELKGRTTAPDQIARIDEILGNIQKIRDK